MSFDNKFCNICLLQTDFLINTNDSDHNNSTWLCKMQSILPELDGIGNCLICKNCTQRLDDYYKFKKLLVDLLKRYTISSESSSKDLHLSKCKVEDRRESLEKRCSSFEEENNSGIIEDDSTHSEIDLFYKSMDSKVCISKTLLQIGQENLIRESWICSLCNNAFDCDDKLRNHECCKIQCTYCQNIFISDSSLKQHLQNCELKSRFCSQKRKSNEVFDKTDKQTKAKYVNELKNPRGRKPLLSVSCEICGNSFNYVKHLTEHCSKVHSIEAKDVKPYSCSKCENRFSTLTNLNQHLRYHEDIRSKICSICGKAFKTASDLTVHEYTHLNRRNYKCEDCSKAFNTNKNLRTHILVVHTDRSLWKHHCGLCGKRFPLKANYDQHCRRHNGEKLHTCQFCGKSFISNSELKRHIELHSNIKRHKCIPCNKEYKTHRSYKAHFNSKHLGSQQKIPTREKKFVCHICPSQFYDKSKLLRHLCSHSGLKPFCCNVCGKKFTDKSYLKHHLKVAHNFVEQLDVVNI